jgi:type IV pilus assembly protein PilV
MFLRSPMRSRPSIRRAQEGAFLLEALIGILIFSLGVLGIVGLQAQSIRLTNDAEYRAEAVYLANSLISQMWADNRTTLKARYEGPAGPMFIPFNADVHARLVGAILHDPVVKVDATDGTLPLAPSNHSSVVQVQITWQMPGDSVEHNYTTTGVIGQN